MNERNLIGNILAEENDSDEETVSRYAKTKRHILLDKDELSQLQLRSTSAPANFIPFPHSYWEPYSLPEEQESYASLYTSPPGFEPNLDIQAPEFVPSFYSPAPSPPQPAKTELSDLRGRVIEMSQDQSGSRFLQQKYPTACPADKQLIFEEVLRSAYNLMIDVFGNYVVQKILEFGTREQKRVLAHQMSGKVVELSMHMYGCRVVQKSLEVTEIEQRKLIVQELRGHVERCMNDQNGNHVIQKCFENLPFQHVDFIVDCIRQNSVHWAMHAYGCRIMQRMIEYCPREAIQDILTNIENKAVDISKEAYGNYVIQHLLDKGQNIDKRLIIRAYPGRLRDLAKHKFASNVIEKCLQIANQEEVRIYTTELFTSEAAFELMTDRFANFVMQKGLEVARGELQKFLISKVNEFSASLRTFPYGRHVLNCLEKIKKGK
mmetsp:Transcript_8731/g.12984  ORF Transcript_8731/g.12984 Transcript_8731/m.12984 type:complete len:434 (+) Transcript_8731:31-1332(+)